MKLLFHFGGDWNFEEAGRKQGKGLCSFGTTLRRSAHGCGPELGIPERKPRRRLLKHLGEIRDVVDKGLGLK